MILLETVYEFAKTYAQHFNYAAASDGDFALMIFRNSLCCMNMVLCAASDARCKAQSEMIGAPDKYWRHLNEET
jgi:hypothetical protein